MKISAVVTVLLLLCCMNAAASGQFFLAPAQPYVQDQELSARFCWEPLPGAKTYTIQVAGNLAFTQISIDKTIKDTAFILNGLESKTTYYWRVSAEDRSGQKILNAGGVQSFVTPVVVLPASADIFRGRAVVDGIETTYEWENATELRLQYYGAGAQAGNHPDPEARMMWDDSALYILLKTKTPKGNPPSVSVSDHDGPVYTDEAFEIFLLPPDSMTYYQFIFNWKGAQYDGKGSDAGFNPAWSVKTEIDGDSVVAEVAIPWSQIDAKPKAGDVWKCNLAADFDRQSFVRSWSKYGFMLGDPKTFGTITLVDKEAGK